MEKRKTISFNISESDHQKVREYARAKGHGGQFPASTFAHYAVFQMMKKYPLSEAEIREIERNIEYEGKPSKAVQPDALTGKKKEGLGVKK